MNKLSLPIRLRKEPLIDAIFEIRFDSTKAPVASVLPGLFFLNLSDLEEVERLPQAEIPEQFRKSDPALQYMPIIKLKLMDYDLLIGDKSLAVASKLPYKGWANFKAAIKRILPIVEKSNIITSVERYSMKYIDIIENSATLATKSANITMMMGGRNITDHPFHLKTEYPVDGFINIVQIVSDVTINLVNGKTKTGMVIDIDTIKSGDNLLTLDDLSIERVLDAIHTVSKKTFFECLTDETIANLDPIYE